MKKGFTLIEILVVIFILGISVTLITLNFSSLNSIEKQAKSFEYTFDVLSQEIRCITLSTPLWENC